MSIASNKASVLTRTQGFMDMTITTLKAFFKAWGKAIIDSRQESANREIARMQLHGLTDRELWDIGITRGDINNVVK